MSQILYTKTGKLGSSNQGVQEARVEPAIHIQIFDTAKKELTTAALHGVASGGGGGSGALGTQEATAISEANLGKLKRRPLRKSRNMKM
jgi:hypothetical protein